MPGDRPAVRSSPVTALLAAIVLAGALYVGFTPIGAAPALGKFLDPVHGVWAVATRAHLPAEQSQEIRGLTTPVSVRYDDRGVPHIFATNTLDAIRALGWVHARDRLFQMEIQSRAVAGTLSELAGTRVLALDRESRLQGLAWSAERNAVLTDTLSQSGKEAAAYSDGVNTYINTLTDADIPFEYHLLGARPLQWRPAYSAYLLARMGLTLTLDTSNEELRRAQVDALVGKAATDALFPVNEPLVEPIQPNGQKTARADWIKIPAPAPPNASKLAITQALERTLAVSAATVLPMSADAIKDATSGEAAVGSNNWAVSPNRAAAGHALLAGDPHLQLSLPSIWYEVHIVVKDTLDAYGVSLPGAPFMPIGFNRDVAWSATNTGADVADYYIETVDNDAQPTKYKLDGEWKALVLRIERFRDKKGALLATDTIYHTHRGPMLRVDNKWVSRRWTVLDPNDALSAIRSMSFARSSAELMKSLETYAVPAQNFITADRGGHIMIRSTGHYPVRPASNPDGNVLIDGSTTANDWKGWWPVADYPQSADPAQGYLASNNQQPKDPKVDPRYLGSDWATPWRAIRINQLLRSDSAVTPEKMRAFQTDPFSAQVQYFLPFIRAAAAAPAGTDSAIIARAAKLLADWDGNFRKDNQRAVLYETIVDEITKRTWDELRRPGDKTRNVATPNSMILLELMQDANNIWWDDRSTPNVTEDRDMIIRAAIAAAYRRVVVEHGEEGVAWSWDRIRHANIYHLLRLPGLNRLNVPVQGGSTTLAPALADGTHGASWRMVVELGPDVRAWGTYPGGQSGNPSSPRYDDRIGRWSAGTLDTLRFPRTAAELSGHTLTSTLTLTPVRK